jgi:hypothetical protein
VFATNRDPNQPAQLYSLITIHACRLQTILGVEKLIANIMDSDQTVWMRRLVWIHAWRKRIFLFWHGAAYMVIPLAQPTIVLSISRLYIALRHPAGYILHWFRIHVSMKQQCLFMQYETNMFISVCVR